MGERESGNERKSRGVTEREKEREGEDIGRDTGGDINRERYSGEERGC